MIQFQWCKLFQDTFAAKARQNPELVRIFNEFRKIKEKNPMQPFGSRDAAFNGEGNFNRAVPKMRHAHLMHDLNLCYTVMGKDPTIIRLYGVFKHDELGTGQPANMKRQKSVATSMANQSFMNAPEPKPVAQSTAPGTYKDAAWYKNQNK